jgi:transmembrane sensor
VWRWVVPIAAALVLAIFLTLVGVAKHPFTPSVAEADNGIPTSERYETHIGERRQVRLSDGSIVTLNTGSLVEVAYTAQRRNVRLLRGEAMFKVAHNAQWPFVVTAGDRDVTAVGTAFVVRVDGPAIKVVLVQGKVKVDPLRPVGLARVIPQLSEDDLTPGEQLIAFEGRRKVTIATADVQRALSWENGQVIFRDDTIQTAVAELNRYTDTRILVGDPHILALTVSGVFNARRPEDFVAAVTSFYPIVAVHPSADVTELRWRDNS